MGSTDNERRPIEDHSVDWHFAAAEAPGEAQRRYREQLAVFNKRRRIAFVVRVATTALAVALLAMGVALVASSFTTISNEYLAKRHVPGVDGSISIATAGSYALAQTEGGALPACGIVNTQGDAVVPLTHWEAPGNPPLDTWRFDAAEGRYLVTCEGGNDGVVVYAADSIDMLQRGYFGFILQAIPFLVLGVALYWGGKVAARRILPESLRPIIPS